MSAPSPQEIDGTLCLRGESPRSLTSKLSANTYRAALAASEGIGSHSRNNRVGTHRSRIDSGSRVVVGPLAVGYIRVGRVLVNASNCMSPDRSIKQLTAREREVLDLVGVHMTNKEIALELAIAPTTVDKHLRSIRDKWGTTSRHETARVMQQLGGWEKPHPDFSSDDAYLITEEGLSPDLPRSSEFVLEDVLASEQPRQFVVPAPRGLEALDERFGKSWRVALIPLSALLFGLVLIWALMFAKELNDLL